MTSRNEPMRGVMDAISDPLVHTVAVMSSAQVGKTETLLNIIGYHVEQDAAPILLLQPTLEMGEAFSKDRLAPMVRDTPALLGRIKDPRSRDSGNTLLHKTFQGGHITIAGANSPASLASRPIRIVLADEVDRYPVSAGTEGDPVSLARKRSTTFWNRKTVLTSTPTVKGFSRIEAEWEVSDQRRFHLSCPDCEHSQFLKWAQVKWPDGNPHEAAYACEECGSIWEDPTRWALLRKGRWIATAPFNGTAGFHLNEIYSPWVRLGDMAAGFLTAKRSPETLKTWINTSLGESFEEDAERVDGHALMSRLEEFAVDEDQRTIAPNAVLAITCGVDVQDDRLEVERIGWGVEEESWSLDHRILYGDPSGPELWKELDEYRMTPTTRADGTVLPVHAMAIDSGGHHTAAVHRFAKDRFRQRVYAIKGLGGPGKPIWPKRASKNNKARINQFMVGVDAGKDAVYARLKITEPGPGYCHFPKGRDPAYFEQITAEIVQTKYVKGFPSRVYVLPGGRRNEALDCFDSETEVLTANGWRRFSSLDGSEKLATVNLNTRLIEYQFPSHLIAKQHEGDMVELKGRRLDILVTPNHRMVTFKKVFDRKARKWNFDVPPEITLAKDLTVHHSLMMAAGWAGDDAPTRTIPECNADGIRMKIAPAVEVDAEAWAAFLGWYIAEGCRFAGRSKTQGNVQRRVMLYQNEGERAGLIRSVLSRLPWKFREEINTSSGNIRFIATSKQLYDAVEECGDGAGNKRVPQWIKDASPRIINRFVDAAILGDGWQQTKPGQRMHRTYATISRQLADDFQELILKVGRAANVRTRILKDWNYLGRTGRSQPQFHVSECKATNAYLDGGGNGRRGYIGKTVPYSGMVYCATVPNGTLVCRRNGLSFIAGNCRVYGYAVLQSLNVRWGVLLAAQAKRPPPKRDDPLPEPVPLQIEAETAPAQPAGVLIPARRGRTVRRSSWMSG